MKQSKNVWVIPTDKPSRLYYNTNAKEYALSYAVLSQGGRVISQNIHITSDEEIKGGDWVYDKILNRVFEFELGEADGDYINENIKKIILTTYQDLIKDGVQAIDDEFLEWFVKNSSCEEVEVERIGFYKPVKNEETDIPEFDCYEYKIIIPKEEPKEREMFLMNATTVIDTRKPKQETLEEAAKRYTKEEIGLGFYPDIEIAFEKGAKWQEERMYSEEEVHKILGSYSAHIPSFSPTFTYQEWFEQFKNK